MPAVGPLLAQVQEIGPPSRSVTAAEKASGTFRDWYVVPRMSGGITISGTVLIA